MVTSLQHRSDPGLRIVHVRVVPQGVLPEHSHKLVLRLLRLRAKNERRGTQQHRHRRAAIDSSTAKGEGGGGERDGCIHCNASHCR